MGFYRDVRPAGQDDRIAEVERLDVRRCARFVDRGPRFHVADKAFFRVETCRRMR